MNNIQFLLLCALIGSVVAAGPAAGTTPLLLSRSIAANSRAVFIVHLLTRPVDPEKKNAYAVLTEGQKVSLPSPNQHQTRLRLP